MRKFLLILLAVALCSSLVACVDSLPNDPESSEESVSSSASKTSSASTSSSKAPASSESKAPASSEPAEPSEPESFKNEIDTEDKFFNSNAYIQLMYKVFETYNESLDDIETTHDYYFKSLSYDTSTQSATVQVPCVKNGKAQYLTISYNYTYVGDLKTWVLDNLEYTETLKENTVGNDSRFIYKYYGEIQNIAFRFFRAYIQGDEQTALYHIDSLDNPFMERFNTEKGSFKDEKTFAVEFMGYDYNKEEGTGTVSVRVHFKRDDKINYMTLTINTTDSIDANGKDIKKFAVSNFELSVKE